MANAQQVTTANGDEVDLKRVDAAVMAKSVKALGIKVGKGATVQELVGALSGYFAAKEAKGEESGNCSTCGITYTFDLDACPACGTAADDGEEAEEEESGEVETEDSGDSDHGGEEGGEGSEPEPAAAAPPPVAEEAPKRRKKKAPEPPVAAAPAATLPRGNVTPPKPAKAAPVTTTAIVSAKELDAAVADVRAAMSEGAASYWKIGQKLKAIYDADLWKQRSVDGKPAYKSWDKFVTVEIGMHVVTSYDAMRVAASFDEKTVRQIGQKKLALLLKAPEVTQDALLQKAKDGASTREMEAEVKAARDKYGPPKSKMKGSKRTEKAAKAKSSKPAKKVDKITVAQIINEPHRIPLFTEESLKAGPGHRVRATKFGQKPSGSLVLVNGVAMHVRVSMTDKGAVAVVNFKRQE